MVLDPATLVVVACIMSLVLGALLLFSWLQDRRIEALRWWSAACLVAAAASVLFLAGGHEMRSIWREIGNGAFMLAYGLSYLAARRFNEQSAPWTALIAGMVIWLSAVWVFDVTFVQRVVLMSLLIGGYAIVTARELWNGPDRLVSQRAAAVVTALNGIYFLGRIFAGPGLLPSFSWMQGFSDAWVSMVGLVILLYAMIFGFLVMSMAKEKTDLFHRRAALIDPLTGVANRRAFMVRAESMLAEARQAGEPAAVIMFDLDHFKVVNDTHGHLAGDDVLTEFAAIAVDRLPRRSMLCRMGGEEFAAIVPGTDHVSALDIAERIRLDLCSGARKIPATVSAGVAMSSTSRESLADLLSMADEALYNAKKTGRNRVVAAMGSPGRAPASKPVQPQLDAALA
ncbi:diguanylate cyclase [Sphingoaurantiacus capsulatus]|uniref:diguanylate cyclase n=1 Tax=Sphingoaurantiacus capsulatus TaxID=1771310 RepID=A0ABV7XCK1_9SPHN